MGECTCGKPHDWQRLESSIPEAVVYAVDNRDDLIYQRLLPLDLEAAIMRLGAEKVLQELRQMAEKRTLEVILHGSYVDLEDIDEMLALIQTGKWPQEGAHGD